MVKYEVLVFYKPMTEIPLAQGIWINVLRAQELPNGSLYAELKNLVNVTVDAPAWRKKYVPASC